MMMGTLSAASGMQFFLAFRINERPRSNDAPAHDVCVHDICEYILHIHSEDACRSTSGVCGWARTKKVVY